MIFSVFFFHQRGKKNTCLLAASSSPASPNLSLPRYWLAGAAAVLVLAVSSRWGRAVPLNQCPVVKEVSARKCSTRSCSRQHWQLSMRLSMGMAWPSDGWDQQWKTNKCKQTICRVHTHTHTHSHICWFVSTLHWQISILKPFPKKYLGIPFHRAT